MQKEHSYTDREGTARNRRTAAALLPDYFLLDERSLEDRIAMARKLSKHLRHFDFDNQESGNWSSFAGQEIQQPVAEIEAFLEDPDRFARDPEKQAWLSRPHFVLFLTFLELLARQQTEINRFTRRHLDYFYRQVLGIAPKAALPDTAHLVFEPARGVQEQRIEAGAMVQAGHTPDGKTRYLRTREEIVVNRAKVADVKVFFQERKVLGLEEVYQEHIKKNSQDTQGAIAKLLLLVLPSQPTVGNNKLLTELVINKNWNFLSQNVKRVLDFPKEVLGLSLFELRRLNALIGKQRNNRNSDWRRFNEYLLKAGRKRLEQNPNLSQQLSLQPHDAFEVNFKKAMNFEWNTPRGIYDRIQNVEDIFELFDLLQDTDKQRYDALIQEYFYLSAEDFCAMMEAFDHIRKDWRGINGLLDKISKKNNPALVGNWKAWPDFFNAGYGGLATDSTFYHRLSITSGLFYFPGISASQHTDFMVFRWDIENAERFFNLSAEEIQSLISQYENLTDLPRLLMLLEKAQLGRLISEKAADFEARFRLKSSSAAIHNRYKLLEENFGIKSPDGKYFVLPPYPPTETKAQRTDEMLQALHEHWMEGDPSEKAQARRYLENTFHLRVEEMDDFLDHLQLSLPPEPQWDGFYRIVAGALLRREGGNTRAVEVQHQGFFAAPDATLLRSDRPEESHPRWRTFGRTEDKERDKTKLVGTAELGLVIESPLLEMKGGTRKITLNFHDANIATAIANNFDFFISVADEKEPFFQIFPTEPAANSTEITLTLKPEAPAVVRPTDTVLGPVVATPVLKIEWRGAATNYDKPTTRIEKISLSVNVTDVMPDAAWNDEGEVNPQRPFEPFGAHPRVGSKFKFAHIESFSKPLEYLGMTFLWMGMPDLKTHYLSYRIPINWTFENNGFTAAVFLQNRGGQANTVDSVDLFYKNQSIKELVSGQIRSFGKIHPYHIIGLELGYPDFQHDRYLQLISGATGTTVTTTTNGNKTTTEITPRPNPPYTPKLQSFRLDYETKPVQITPDISSPHRVWQLHPFGVAMPAEGEKLRLVPELPYEAELYIGLEDIQPGQSVHILFQVAEGSSDPEQARRPVRWQYLSAEGWRSAAERSGQPLLLDDPSDQLSRSAVLRFHLPEDAVNNNQLMPAGKYWLRAAIAEQRGSVCDIIGLHTQAVAALRVPDTGSDDPGIALPPDTAKGLQQRLPGIKVLSQPYSSFGGRSPESDTDYYRRSAERLRHKQRALSLYDIERLLLEEYPELYRVKCLPATDTPGLVEVVALPDQRGRLPQDPLQPRLPQATLDRMAAWLQSLGPQPARYRLRNARFLPLQVKARLRLRPGYDEAYYLCQLSEELTRYLSPWAYDDNADIRFGGTVYVGQILNFIEERPYVDHITHLSLRWKDMDGKTHTATDAVSAPRPNIIWVSEPTHDLKTTESFVPERPRRGIGEMAVEIDFLIH